MRYIFFLVFTSAVFVHCVRSITTEEIQEMCPYEKKYLPWHHQFEVPFSVIPHQKVYAVGDTITLRSFFSDSIYDNNMQTRFKVKNFPFEPYILLYKFTEDGFEHGYRLNQPLVEDKYDARYVNGLIRADEVRGHMIYEEDHYHYEMKIVLETPGVYSTFMGDVFDGVPRDFRDARLAEILAQIEFEEYCGQSFSPKLIIQGDPHYNDYLEELTLLDDVIYFGSLGDLGDVLEGGRETIEWRGVFFFEVVE